MVARAVILALVSLGALSVGGVAQPLQSRLTGRILDGQGQPIPGAAVIVLADPSDPAGYISSWDPAWQKLIRSDEHGMYSLPLGPGIYDVFVSMPTFDPRCAKVRLVSGSPTVLDMELRLSAVVSAVLGDRF
jgi:Carboxypeptidase regulatory-like domain